MVAPDSLFFRSEELAVAEAIAGLLYANPFLRDRIEYERRVLGDAFADAGVVWSVRADREVQNPNLAKIAARARELVDRVRPRLSERAWEAGEVALYEDVVTYVLYDRYEDRLYRLFVDAPEATRRQAGFFDDFARDLAQLRGPLRAPVDAAHLFACLYQVRRAFQYTFRCIIGSSRPAAQLRAAVWQSIFTRDLRRYRRSLYRRMGDATCLILGPSGTGKELVARAIGMSRYVPFHARTRTFDETEAGFHPLHLSAMPPTLIESELFGHRRGAFTGALDDRAGWFETCGAWGTVFLDEIGELDASIQVKLLRVLQSREFQRLGESRLRSFQGKVIAATNRDLGEEMRAGRFRQDLYYRLCSDIVRTPGLREQLRDQPDDLHNLVLHIARRVVGEEEAEVVAREAVDWIESRLGRDYAWPGNVRELEQCVRNLVIRGEYQAPLASPEALAPSPAGHAFAAELESGRLTAEELLNRYCALVYARCGSYVETARRLGLDRRTVKARVDAGRPGVPPR